MSGFVFLVSVIVFLWAVVGIIRPAWARLPNRLAAVGVWALSFVLFLIGGALAPDQPAPAATARTATAPAAAPAPVPAADQLALVAMRGADGGYGYHTVEGQVTNLTDQNLDNVMAVVTWLTDEDQFVTTDEALINFNPVLPGQTSPFEVMSQTNPAMSRFRVEFKTLFGGTLRFDDQR